MAGPSRQRKRHPGGIRKTVPSGHIHSNPLAQGCPTLLMAINCPAKFSSNPNQTHLKQLINVFRIA